MSKKRKKGCLEPISILLLVRQYNSMKMINRVAARPQPAKVSDAEMAGLLRRAQRHDRAAFDRLYELYADKIYRYIRYRVQDEHVAEDLTAEVFLRLLEGIRAFRVTERDQVAIFSGYLYRIAHNLLYDYYQRQTRRPVAALDEQVSDSAESHRMWIERGLTDAQLHSAIAALTEDQQQVLVIRFFDEMSSAEVARVMGKTEGAIKALQHRALVALERILGRAEPWGELA